MNIGDKMNTGDKIVLRPEAKRLLRRVQGKTRKNPTSFNIDILLKKESGGVIELPGVDLREELIPPCRTVGCIAGLINMMLGKKSCSSVTAARRALGLTPKQADTLFFAGDWPWPFWKQDSDLYRELSNLDRELYNRTLDGKPIRRVLGQIKKVIAKRGEVACARIDMLIEEGW